MPQAWTKKVNLRGPKGDPGSNAGFGTPTASIQNEGGEPSVIVTATGEDTAKVFDFTFHNIKGDKGDPGATEATGVSYDKNDQTNVGGALDDIYKRLDDIQYEPIAVTSMSVSPSQAEKGSTVTSVTVSWNVNKDPKSATLNDEPVEPADRSKTFSDLSLKQNTTYTYKATDERDATAQRSATLSFLDKRYWGVGTVTEPDQVDSAFVLGLSGSELSSSKTKTFTVNAGAGQYIYYAIPASFGTPVFYVGGFEGGFDVINSFEFTNASGYKTNYNVWKSTNANLGSTTVEAR